MRARVTLAFLCACICARPQDLGEVNFRTSAGPAAQKQFLKGLLELHSFEYDDAREDFQAARATEPGFAMAYWGEAMTYNHPLWGEQDTTAARAALKKIPAGARMDPRERLYVNAVRTLYGDGSQARRDAAYAEAMHGIYEKYPADADAACFYALSLLGATEGKRDTAVYMRAAAILEDVFKEHPRHPGAAHYLIHSYDDPEHAHLGLAAARVYASIAPAAEHAQHMPSHIFFALGMWDDAVASNETSWSVSEARVTRKKLGVEELGYHALSWLEYAYLQQGRYQDARRVLGIMEENARRSNATRVRGSMIFMRAAYLAETGQWTSPVQTVSTDGLSAGARATDQFINALAKLQTGSIAGPEDVIRRLRAGSPGAQAMGGQLESALRMKEGKVEDALAAAASAAEKEDRLNYEFGPPFPVIPAHEFYGEMLLRAGRTKDAAKQFALALRRAPGRAHSLLGLARTGDKDALEKLKQNWRRADAEVKDPVLAEFRSSPDGRTN
ncbi:MAG TPA: hypothetical protein VHD76_18995 [Bryobacteraceae bacterium]|nr:hypothetical protein [Bryobacteraceae bacterium]